MKKFFLIVCSVFLFFGCKKTKSVFSGHVLDVVQLLSEKIEVPMSELSNSMEYVLLETNDSVLLHQNAHVFYSDDSDILIRSKQFILHFNSKGDFLNRIGKIGNGPHEYNVIYNVSVDATHKLLFLYVGQKKIYIMSYDGNLQHELNLQTNEDVTAAYWVNENLIMAETRAYSDAGLKVGLSFFDMQGMCVTKDVVVFTDNLHTERHMHTMPMMYAFQNKAKYMGTYSNILYEFQNKTIKDSIIFDFGPYQPDRDHIENMNKREELLKNYASLVDIQENSETMYLLIIFRKKLKGIVVDKSNGKVLFSSYIDMPQRGGGIKNDYLYNCNFWPTYMDDKALYCLLSPEILKESMFVPDSIREHVDDDDNPVLLKLLLSSK